MTKLFPENFISGSITNQAGLNTALLQFPNYSKTFIAIALAKPEIRRWYEDRWPQLQKYLDRDFEAKFQSESEHSARAWEFYLGSVLLERGLALEEKTSDAGPDFCVKVSEMQKIWIEAIACDLGEADPVPPIPEMVTGVMYSCGGNIEDDNRPKVLRITNAIGTKLEKFKSYLQYLHSDISGNDCLVIAVNGAAIEHISNSNMLLKRAVFGQGPDVYVRRKGEEKFKGPFYQPIPTVTKRAKTGDETIPANFMEMVEFSIISAVIYCGHRAYDCELNGYNAGDNFLFAYHTHPKNPIPDGFFKFGRGIRKNLQDATITDRKQL